MAEVFMHCRTCCLNSSYNPACPSPLSLPQHTLGHVVGCGAVPPLLLAQVHEEERQICKYKARKEGGPGRRQEPGGRRIREGAGRRGRDGSYHLRKGDNGHRLPTNILPSSALLVSRCTWLPPPAYQHATLLCCLRRNPWCSWFLLLAYQHVHACAPALCCPPVADV